MSAPLVKLTKKDFVSDQEVRWCPGCADFAILAGVQKLMPELGIEREKIVFISGQTAWDERKNIVGGDSVLEQARQALRNVKKAVDMAGGTLNDVVALRIYVVDYQAESGTAVGTVLREFFSQENPPASTWIGVSALAVPEFLIEIEATAVLD